MMTQTTKTPPTHLRGFETLAAAERAAKVIMDNGFRVGVSRENSTGEFTVSVTNKKKA